MITDNKVRIFTSAMFGAPNVNTSAAGSMIALLDACLVNGFGLRTLAANAMTRSGTTVTVAQAGHGYPDHSVVQIAGADQLDYNGSWRVLVDDVDHYSYQLPVAGSSATTATGTITSKTPSAGWAKPFSGTNLAAYRPADGPRHYLRVDDTAWSSVKCRVRAYRSMTDVNSGLGVYPRLDQAPLNAFNWMRHAGGGVGWTIVADDKAMHIQVDTANGQSGCPMYYFGWFKDLYGFDTDANSMITAGTFNTVYSTSGDGTGNYEAARKMWSGEYVTNSDVNATTEQCHGYLAKSFDGIAESVAFFMMGYGLKGANQNPPYQFNNQIPHVYAAVVYMGNTSGTGSAQSLKGFTFQAPFVCEPSYQNGQNQLRGVLPFLQCLTLYPATTMAGKTMRALDRFGAAYSGLFGYDGWSGSSYPKGFVVPLANWENVL